jgi:hypothetical protein
MVKNTILGLIISTIVFYSLAALADDKYPAANFEPQVIFIDKDVQSPPSGLNNENADPKYPAANFQPQVVYFDNNIQQQIKDSAEEFDPKYPAANFIPRVIYP